MSQEQFDLAPVRHCKVVDGGTITVGFDQYGKVAHDGLVDLAGTYRVEAVPATPGSLTVGRASSDTAPFPAIFHVTHWKAGSQWLCRILRGLAPDRVSAPDLVRNYCTNWPLEEGRVYPTVYMAKDQFDRLQLPRFWRRFVVIRDLRDTLVSAYFGLTRAQRSLLYRMSDQRQHVLASLGKEDGLLYLLDEWLPKVARIRLSWLEGGEALVRYEDLLERDIPILEHVLIDRCEMPISREWLRAVVESSRFERLASGRSPGDEDLTSHARKGISGDWVNHFTDRVGRAFKARYGGLLVETGYEPDLNW